MSSATKVRWRGPGGKFVKTPKLPSIALNSAGVPGGLGFELAEPLNIAGTVWVPADGEPSACPIGAALAAELAAERAGA